MAETRRSVMITTGKLADWLDAQEGTWWWIDGDPDLMSQLNFPCPNEELVDVLRKRHRRLRIILRPEVPNIEGEPDLDAIADTDNRRHEKVLLACWEGSDNEWLIREEKEMAEIARREFAEALNGQTSD
ncbi:hypothetical protein [Aquisphaera insulae]|uniref:hypothetical protein n=1 Tax=Aquisphaera insulae TaxID=2712864 RepID=UPI0013E9D85A|nr:hypothetical protein [Aquisphaera insulae]